MSQMKQVITLITALLLTLNISAQDINLAYKAKTVTFLGLDYTAAIFIGSVGFNDPAALQFLPNSWNSLFISEPNKYNVQKAFQVRMKYNFDIVKSRNNSTDFSDRITDKEIQLPHLTKSDLQAIVNSYPDFENDGVALVFVVDAYNKLGPTAYYHIVFFQMKTKEVLLTYAVTGEAGGGGLRNYWANSFYKAIIIAGKRYASTAEFYKNYTE